MTTLQAQVDTFDEIYNTQRPHQGLPGRITPQQAWDATPLAEAPRPRPRLEPITPAVADSTDKAIRQHPGTADNRLRLVASNGVVPVNATMYNLTRARSGQTVQYQADETSITFATLDGEHISTYPAAAKGTPYVKSSIAPKHTKPKASPKS